MENMFIEGMLIREIFRNKDNDFAICSLLLTGHNTTEEMLKGATKPVYEADIPSGFGGDDYGAVTISGYFPALDEEKSYYFTGKWTNHPRYGWQFQVATFKSNQIPITSNTALIAYLSSDVFKGIGKKTATAVVEKLGVDAIERILADKNLLTGIPGLSAKLRDVLFDTLQSRQGDELILGPLYSYGISPKFVLKILKIYKHEALHIIRENPYQLINDIEGIGFIKADEIAASMGILTDDPRRINAAIIHVMNRVTASEGHTFMVLDQLVHASMEFLAKGGEIPIATIENEVRALVKKEQLIEWDGCLFLPALFHAEEIVAKKVEMLKTFEQVAQKKIEDAFNEVKNDLNIDYSPKQTNAIMTSLSSGMSIITGGPGTGKTTVVKGILATYDKLHENAKKDKIIKLASPTGRAAKRMTETTKKDASTIHRLLEYDRNGTFGINADEPLEADLVIIDEVSMLDTYLAYQLLSSLLPDTQVIFVGDDNQLPSVGPGQVLKDLIDAQIVPITRLTDIHRQAEGSSVISLAHDINGGRLPENLGEKLPDRLFVPAATEDILRLLKQVTTSAIAKGYTAKDVQILIPMYRGMLGIDGVNVSLQALFNPPADDKEELVMGQKIYREGDKVLQLVNNPDAGVMNGDVGEIVRVINAGNKSEILVDFDDIEVAYNREDLITLTHAYAMSIHKSQGSEYPVVIMPITRAYWIMLKRKLIYTGITRASKSLVLIGDYDALKFAAENEGAKRQTMLKNHLLGSIVVTTAEKKTPTGSDLIHEYQAYFDAHNIPFSHLDEAGMTGRTPYDFM